MRVAPLLLVALAACAATTPARPLYRFADQAIAGPAAPDLRTDGERLLALAVEAKGGRERVQAARGLHATGAIAVSHGGTRVEGSFERWLAGDRQRLDVTIDGRTISVIIAGDEVVQRDGSRTVPIDGAAADALVDDLWRDRDQVLANALTPTGSVRADGTAVVDGVTCDALVVARAGQPLARLLLDPGTHLIARIEALGDGGAGHEDDGDYRDVDGIRIAHRVAMIGPGARTDLTVAAVELTAPADDVFALAP